MSKFRKFLRPARKRTRVGAQYLKDRALDVCVRQALDVPVLDLLVPNLERLAAYTVQER